MAAPVPTTATQKFDTLTLAIAVLLAPISVASCVYLWGAAREKIDVGQMKQLRAQWKELRQNEPVPCPPDYSKQYTQIEERIRGIYDRNPAIYLYLKDR